MPETIVRDQATAPSNKYTLFTASLVGDVSYYLFLLITHGLQHWRLQETSGVTEDGNEKQGDAGSAVLLSLLPTALPG